MRHRPIFTFALLAALAWSQVASADMITVSAIQQQANLSATYGSVSHQPGVYNQAGPSAQNHEAKILVADGMGGFAGTTTKANQFQLGSSYALNPNASLALSVVGSNSGSIVNVIDQVGDEASVSERLEFIFQTDRELLFSLDAMILSAGNRISVQNLNDANNGASVVIALRNNTNSLFAIYDIDATPSINVSTTLPADGYKLTVQSVYKVKGNVGESPMGSANYSLDFSVSAVPEPGSLGVLATLACAFSLRRRCRSRR